MPSYREDSALYQALTRAGVQAPLALDEDDDLPPWVDAPEASSTPSSIEDTDMTDTTSTTTDLHAFFGQLGQFPRNNVLERCIQTLISESARAAEFGDRVEFGDNTLPGIELDAAGFPTNAIDSFERPAPDTDGEQHGRTLSEAQYGLLLRLRDDEVTALEMAAELVSVYQAINGEKPPYGLIQSPAGRWERITDIHQALKREYLRAHAAWIRKQGKAADSEATRFAAEGSQSLQQQVRSQRSKVLSGF